VICGHFCKGIRCITLYHFSGWSMKCRIVCSSQTCLLSTCVFRTHVPGMCMCAGWTLWMCLIRSAWGHSTRQAACHSCLASRCGEVSHHHMVTSYRLTSRKTAVFTLWQLTRSVMCAEDRIVAVIQVIIYWKRSNSYLISFGSHFKAAEFIEYYLSLKDDL
jgi:hypothetical protein